MRLRNGALGTLLVVAAAIGVCACGGQSGGATAQEPGEADAQASSDASQPAIEAERYFGRYGDAAQPDELMGMVFITEARPPPMADHFPEIPAGYIMISPAWADVAPYYMKPVSPARFEQDFVSDFAPAPLVALFELDMAGNAVAVTFETVLDGYGRRARLGDVPEEYR